MKNLILSGVTACVLAVSGPALAADLPVKALTAPAPVWSWSGFYVGIHGGYGWGDETRSGPPNFIFTAAVPSIGLRPNGGIYGGQIGYNWQTSDWVFGIEATLSGASLKDSIVSPVFAPDTLSSNLSSIYTITGRLGRAWGPSLLYVRAGLAGARLTSRQEDPFVQRFIEVSDWYTGWTLGLGWEYMFAPAWVFGVEYNYYGFGSKSFLSPTCAIGGACDPVPSQAQTIALSVQAIMARLSYKFGG